MAMLYTVCLNLSKPISGDYIESKITDSLSQLSSINSQYPFVGGVVAKTAQGDSLYFARKYVAFMSSKPKGAVKVLRFALSTAKYIQDELSGIGLEFDPNSIYLEIGNSANIKKLKHIGSISQKRVYDGGDFAYIRGLVGHTIVLGTKEGIAKAPAGKVIVETEGTAQPADSLDDLLDRINNVQSQ